MVGVAAPGCAGIGCADVGVVGVGDRGHRHGSHDTDAGRSGGARRLGCSVVPDASRAGHGRGRGSLGDREASRTGAAGVVTVTGPGVAGAGGGVGDCAGVGVVGEGQGGSRHVDRGHAGGGHGGGARRLSRAVVDDASGRAGDGYRRCSRRDIDYLRCGERGRPEVGGSGDLGLICGDRARTAACDRKGGAGDGAGGACGGVRDHRAGTGGSRGDVGAAGVVRGKVDRDWRSSPRWRGDLDPCEQGANVEGDAVGVRDAVGNGEVLGVVAVVRVVVAPDVGEPGNR